MPARKYDVDLLFDYLTELHAMHVSLIRTVVRPLGIQRMVSKMRASLKALDTDLLQVSEASREARRLKFRKALVVDLIQCLEDLKARPSVQLPSESVH